MEIEEIKKIRSCWWIDLNGWGKRDGLGGDVIILKSGNQESVMDKLNW